MIEMLSMRGCMRWKTTQQPNTPTNSGFGEKVSIEDTQSFQLLLLSRLFLNYLKYSQEVFSSSFSTPRSFGTIYGLIRPRDLCIQAQMLIDVYGTLSNRLKTQMAFWFWALGLILGLTQTFSYGTLCSVNLCLFLTQTILWYLETVTLLHTKLYTLVYNWLDCTELGQLPLGLPPWYWAPFYTTQKPQVAYNGKCRGMACFEERQMREYTWTGQHGARSIYVTYVQ